MLEIRQLYQRVIGQHIDLKQTLTKIISFDTTSFTTIVELDTPIFCRYQIIQDNNERGNIKKMNFTHYYEKDNQQRDGLNF